MNMFIVWWPTMLALVNYSLAAVLPHSSGRTHHTSLDGPSMDQQSWSSGMDAELRKFPLLESDASPFLDNDRSVYDPGDVEPNSRQSSSSAFIDALTESFITDDTSAADRRRQQQLELAAAVPDGETDAQTAVIANGDALLEKHVNMLGTLRGEIKEDEDVAVKSAMLLKLLESTANDESLPIVYVEDENTADDSSGELSQMPGKRNGRYYRRYPWKRQQTTRYQTYESDQRYLCVPSRDDVFKLLVGLHDNRKGNQNRSINFCNRKRPAKQVFTSIRFLG